MSDLHKLNAEQIQQALLCGNAYVFDEIDSTNEFLLKHYRELKNGSICLAESQTAGRGRRGRQWYSPNSENLYFSLLWRYDATQLEQLPALSLVVSLIIAESLVAQGVEAIQIKWPNDIYHQGKKMGGILIESKADKEGAFLVIGIGLNLAMQNVDEKVVTQRWSDLSHYQFDRNQLVCQLACALQKNLQIYPLLGFEHYLTRWQAFDLFYQQQVTLITDQHAISGISRGINEKGELKLWLPESACEQTFAIGEISLRAGNQAN